MLLETFIKGIEVLDKIEIKEPTDEAFVTGLIIGVILYAIIKHFLEENILAEFIGAVIIICATLGLTYLSIHPTGKYEYKVTITDEVSLNEFYEKYEITDQEGKIYTIRIKE